MERLIFSRNQALSALACAFAAAALLFFYSLLFSYGQRHSTTNGFVGSWSSTTINAAQIAEDAIVETGVPRNEQTAQAARTVIDMIENYSFVFTIRPDRTGSFEAFRASWEPQHDGTILFCVHQNEPLFFSISNDVGDDLLSAVSQNDGAKMLLTRLDPK